MSDTHSINLSASDNFVKSGNEEPLIDGLMDRISENDLEDLVYEEILDEGTLPYSYVNDERRMLAAIRLMTEYRHFEHCAKTDVRNEFEFSVIKLFTEALTEMLTTKTHMNLIGSFRICTHIVGQFGLNQIQQVTSILQTLQYLP